MHFRGYCQWRNLYYVTQNTMVPGCDNCDIEAVSVHLGQVKNSSIKFRWRTPWLLIPVYRFIQWIMCYHFSYRAQLEILLWKWRKISISSRHKWVNKIYTVFLVLAYLKTSIPYKPLLAIVRCIKCVFYIFSRNLHTIHSAACHITRLFTQIFIGNRYQWFAGTFLDWYPVYICNEKGILFSLSFGYRLLTGEINNYNAA